MTRSVEIGHNGDMTDFNPIRAWREIHNVAVKDLAQRVGVQSSAICKWERGKVSSKKALRLHQATGIPLHVLRPDIYPAPEKAA